MSQISLEEFFLIAEAVLDRAAEEIRGETSIGRLETALGAPFSTYEGIELYPHLHEKAAVLVARLVGARPLRQGNRRVALACAVELVARNDRHHAFAPERAEEVAAVKERLMLGRHSE